MKDKGTVATSDREVSMKTLQMHSLDSVDHLVQPDEAEPVTLASPALLIFTDFNKSQPLMIDSHSRATEAEHEMRKAHVKLKFVVDQSLEMIGVVSFQDLSADTVIKLVASGVSRDEILVTDLMRPRSVLRSIDISDLEKATVGDVIHTLQENGEQHCLVIDRTKHHIRGLISASDIARRLHLPVVIEQTPTFISIFASLHH
jgi:CBS domain containing-hemolysin-like protein